MLLLGPCHGNPLGLGVLGLGGDDLGGSGGGVQRPGYTATPQICPWSCSGLVAMISGTAGPCVSVLLPQQLLGLVPGLLGDDSVAGVEDCFSSISSNLLSPATPSVSSSMCPNYWGSFACWCRTMC